jgi:putative Holliday junction resolvase
MAVDLGARRIGVAVSDGGQRMAFPWGVVERGTDPAVDRRRLAAIAGELGVATVVVGLPLSLDGRQGPAARAAAEEARLLASELEGTGVAVETCDERLTTVTATAALAEGGSRGPAARRKVDAAAATVLLQAWLDAR